MCIRNCTEREHQLKVHRELCEAGGERDCRTGISRSLQGIYAISKVPHLASQMLKIKMKSILRQRATTEELEWSRSKCVHA